MKQFPKHKATMVGVGIGAGLLLLFVGFLLGRRNNSSVTIYQPSLYGEASPSATPVLFSDDQNTCDEGFKRFTGTWFTLCYPESLTRTTEATASMQLFVSANEELRVERDSDEKWSIHLCNVEQEVKVAGYSAVRTTFREPLPTGCGKTIGYATLIQTGHALPFYIGYYKTAGVFSGPSGFESIEQSIAFQDASPSAELQ